MPLIYYFVNNRRYSQTFTMATSPQQPFFGGGHSIRNLSTMAIFWGADTPYGTSLQWPWPPLYNGHFLGGGHSIWNLSIQWPWPPLYNGHFLGADTPYGTSLQWPLSSVPKVAIVRGSTVYKRGTFSVKNGTQLFRERLSEKEHATMPKGIVGGFEFTVLQRNLQEWHERPWTYVYNC